MKKMWNKDNNIIKVGDLTISKIPPEGIKYSDYMIRVIHLVAEHSTEFKNKSQKIKCYDFIFPFVIDTLNMNKRKIDSLKKQVKSTDICYSQLLEMLPDIMSNKKSEIPHSLMVVLSRYRIFFMSYLNITRMEFIQELSKRWDRPMYKCHYNMFNIKDANQCLALLKQWKEELTGSTSIPVKGNIRNYAKKLKQDKLSLV